MGCRTGRVDATTITVRDALIEECPGTGDDAAITGHTILSVCGGASVPYHVSPLHNHGTPKVDAIARGPVSQAYFPGTDRDARGEEDPLVRDGRAEFTRQIRELEVLE